MEYIAHKNKDGIQTVKDHSEATARLSGDFAVDGFKEVCRTIGLYHDIGKYQTDFQKRIAGDAHIKVEHSLCGAKELWETYQRTPLFALLMALCVIGHHSGIPDCGTRADLPDVTSTFFGRLKRQSQDYSQYKKELSAPDVDSEPFFALLKKDCVSKEECIERFAFFVRYCFSCLTDADSLDSMKASGANVPQRFYTDFDECTRLLDEKLGSFRSSTALHTARKRLQSIAFDRIREDAQIYLMNMPTGSGKTLTSIKCALIRAKLTHKKRILYVIPYNSIIDQTVDTFEKLFGNSAQILRHQSSFSYEDDEDANEEVAANYRLVCENWDADLIVTTSVQFFESIYGNKRGKLRKLHNTADSVILFDEAHMMPLEYLQVCLRAVAYITRFLNSEAIFMTATMPDFRAMIEKYALPGAVIRDLIPAGTDFSAFRKNRYRDLGEIADETLAEKAASYASSLIVVNSRKAARAVFALCRGKKYHLSTYMTSLDRARVIKTIRDELCALRDEFPDPASVPEERRVVVVSTSLIEAGVDLDFQAAFRELAGLDNLLQTGGRCNREGLREIGDVYVFRREGGASYTRVEQNILNGILREFDDISSPEAIRAYYDRLYRAKENEIVANSLGRMCERPDMIPFREYSEKLRLIDTRTVSVVVPQEEAAQRLIRDFDAGGVFNSRRAQKYCCSVYPNELEDLIAQGAVRYHSNVAVLENRDYYDPEIGIRFEGQDIYL